MNFGVLIVTLGGRRHTFVVRKSSGRTFKRQSLLLSQHCKHQKCIYYTPGPPPARTGTNPAWRMELNFIVLCLCSLLSANAFRILVVFPISAKSHLILGQGVVRHLMEAGHEVVFITPFPRSDLHPKLREVDISSIADELKKQQSNRFEEFKLKNLIGKSNVGDSASFMYFVSEIHKRVLEHEGVEKLLSDPEEKFDAVIVEWFFAEILAGIPALFQCPLIWLGSTEAHGHILRMIDGIPNPAYNADIFSLSTPPFSFWERGLELWQAFKRHLILNFLIVPYEKSTYSSIFPPLAEKRGVSLPSYEEAAYNGSMMFLNSHPSIGTPFRLPQSVKYIGGYHIDATVKPLPKDLAKLFNESKHGVIYFSMGSHLLSNDMTVEMKESFLKMFAKLKQTVVWKFEGDLENVPSNVHLVKWAPQQSILAHPNLKFFITHGGQLSTTEAIHFGVPVIGMPVLGDQYVNMKAVLRKGFGIMVQLSEDVADDLSVAIDKMLKNHDYKSTAKFLSSIYHDRTNSPGAELVHWTEHVIRTRGAPHLRSPALLLPWYEKMYLDYVVLLIITLLVIRKCLKTFIILIWATKDNEKKNK